MPTPIGSEDAYATPDDVIACCDVRTLGDFLSDTGKRLTPDEVRNSDILLRFLAQASGEFETAVMVSGRYELAELEALTGNALELIAGMVAAHALGRVFERRPDRKAPGMAIAQVKRAADWYEALRHGERILPLQEHADAGRHDHQVETHREVEARRLNTYIARRLFGRRSNRIDGPPGR